MRMTKARKGNDVVIQFEDHVEDGDKPMKCEVRGTLVKKGTKYVTVESWTCLDDPEVNKVNRKVFTILTSTILRYAITYSKWFEE